MKLRKVDRLVINKYYSWFFNLCVLLDFIRIKSIITFKVGEKTEKIVEFYFNKKHPLFIIWIISLMPRLVIPILGFFWWLDGIANLPGEKDPAKDIIVMSRGKMKRQLRALRREYMREHPEEFDGTLDAYESTSKTRRAGKKNKKTAKINLGDASNWSAEDWEEYYFRKYGENYLSDLDRRRSTTTLYSETVETKPKAEIATWNGEVDSSLDDETPEDEIRIDNLYESLRKGYITSLEKFLKKKYNIYPTEFGYALERINRDESGVYLDIDFNFVKVWEGEEKTELLKTIIGEVDRGELQRTSKYLLIDVLEKYDGDVSKIPEEKQKLLKMPFKVSCIPDDLKLKKVGK